VHIMSRIPVKTDAFILVCFFIVFALLYTFVISHSKETLSRELKRSAYDHAERWTQYLETDPGRLDKFLACKVYQTKSPDQPEFLSKISEKLATN